MTSDPGQPSEPDAPRRPHELAPAGRGAALHRGPCRAPESPSVTHRPTTVGDRIMSWVSVRPGHRITPVLPGGPERSRSRLPGGSGEPTPRSRRRSGEDGARVSYRWRGFFIAATWLAVPVSRRWAAAFLVRIGPRKMDGAIFLGPMAGYCWAALPLNSSSSTVLVDFALPLSVPFTAEVVMAKVSVAWAAASDIWSSASRLMLSKVSQARW